jgi:hypothetical protein
VVEPVPELSLPLSPAPSTEALSGPLTEPPVPAQGAQGRPLLTALRTRPLFAPDRQPPAVLFEPEAVEPAAPVPEAAPVLPVAAATAAAPSWTLVGVMRGAPAASSDSVAVALLRDAATGEVFMLKSGGEQDGWRLAEVKRFSIVIAQGNETLEIALADNDGAPPPSRAPSTDVGDAPSMNAPSPDAPQRAP